MSAEPESSVEPEPEYTLSESEPETTVEPEVEPESLLPESFILINSEPQAEAWPEPEPEWNSAFKEWGVAWPLHVYIFGLCYVLAVVFSAICIAALLKSVKAGKGKLTLSLLLMVIFFSTTRTVSLFTEPYYAYNNIPFLTARIMWSVGLPFLTSSFSLVFLVLLDTTKMDIGPPKFQKFSAILIITAVHLVIVVTSDFVVFYEASAKVMLVLCQIVFLAYGFSLAIGYFYVGFKMRQNCSAGSMHESSTIKRLIVLCFVSSATSVAIVGTHIYSAVGVFGVYSNNNIVDAWPWWILQTCLRIEELVSVCVVLTIASNSGHLKQLLSRCGSVVGHCFRGRNQVQEISIQQEFNKNCNLTKDETITKSEFYSEKL
ncbi:uncharacterized protein LOC143078786 [Mytilus galloprovincialis]|uniref:uncharacterized protein LOC143078786 n=1 Tax=Mytilus galloprovincialis TaxID=29158 RepID=UPI003F7C2881